MEIKAPRLTALIVVAAVLLLVVLYKSLGSDIGRLSKQLRTGETDQRVEAAQKLESYRTAKVARILAEYVVDEDLRLAEAAVAGLGRVNEPKYAKAILTALDDPRIDLKVVALAVLPAYPELAEELIEPMIDLMMDESQPEDLRGAAISFLAEVGSLDAIDPLIELMKYTRGPLFDEALGAAETMFTFRFGMNEHRQLDTPENIVRRIESYWTQNETLIRESSSSKETDS